MSLSSKGRACLPTGRPRLEVVAPDRGAQTSLERLLALVALGDEQAFKLLYDEVAGAVLGLVRRVVRDPAQSEEVAQEVLVEVWRTASRFDPSLGSARAWIMTMSHRRAVDRVRSAQRGSAREERYHQATAAVAYDEVAERVEARLERERVRLGLQTLTEIQRQAVTLAYYGGYSYREVAELLGIPLGTVKTRLRDGLIRLRDYLEVDS